MNSERTLIACIVFLAVGLGLILGYCQGTAGFHAAWPASGASLQVSITASGLSAMVGFGATVAGIILLVAAVVQAILGQIPWMRTTPKHDSDPTT